MKSNPLDGRRFQGVFIPKGKTSGDADTLIFQDGRFRSTACEQYGYAEAPYKSEAAGEVIRFETETLSPQYGKLLWSGSVHKGKLDATVIMVRDGQENTENWVVAAEAR